MQRKKQVPQSIIEERANVYARLLDRVGFPTLMCGALMYVLFVLYHDIKNIAVEQIKQTAESVNLQKQMLNKLDAIEKEATNAHNKIATTP